MNEPVSVTNIWLKVIQQRGREERKGFHILLLITINLITINLMAENSKDLLSYSSRVQSLKQVRRAAFLLEVLGDNPFPRLLASRGHLSSLA